MIAAIPFILSIVFFLGVAGTQLVFGWLGLEMVGWWAPIVALVLLFTLRIALPFTVASYFGATMAMGWPWWAGLLIAMPGLAFIVPSMIGAALSSFTRRY